MKQESTAWRWFGGNGSSSARSQKLRHPPNFIGVGGNSTLKFMDTSLGRYNPVCRRFRMGCTLRRNRKRHLLCIHANRPDADGCNPMYIVCRYLLTLAADGTP